MNVVVGLGVGVSVAVRVKIGPIDRLSLDRHKGGDGRGLAPGENEAEERDRHE